MKVSNQALYNKMQYLSTICYSEMKRKWKDSEPLLEIYFRKYMYMIFFFIKSQENYISYLHI